MNPNVRISWVAGILLGAMVWITGVEQGFHNGFDRGIQQLETGQVELRSDGSGFDDYFHVRALTEGVAGVVATSARLEFRAVVTNPRGEQRSVLVRAVNFQREAQVTSFGARIADGVSGPISGFLSPEAWQKDGFLFPSETITLTVARGPGEGRSTQAPVNGTLLQTFDPEGPDYAVIDLESALSLLGSEGKVSTIAIRLDPKIPADLWVDQNAESFRGLDATLVPWERAAKPLQDRLTSAAQVLFVVRDVLFLAGFVVILTAGWVDRRKGGTWMWPFPSPSGEVRREFLVLLIGAILTAGALWLAFPLWQGLLVRNLVAHYPFVGNLELGWEPSWLVFLAPLGTILVGRMLPWFLVKPGEARG
jgi:hypothetical protein